jgi:hypothetical protein
MTVTRVEVTALTVRVGDAIEIGGRLFQVLRIAPLHGGARRLLFVSGEILAVRRGTTFTVLRADPPGLRRHSFWEGWEEGPR